MAKLEQLPPITPGPWKYTTDRPDYSITPDRDSCDRENDFEICRVVAGWSDSDSNVAAIVAVPEMIEALLAAREALEHSSSPACFNKHRALVRKALAKATCRPAIKTCKE